MHSLLPSWNALSIESPPFVLPGDDALLEGPGLICRFVGWDSYIADPDFGSSSNSQLHVDLLPVPFMGNLKDASIFFLMLNPGLGPHDYFGEYKVPEYRKALISNLHQDTDNSFLFLDPRFSWHGGFNYWHNKLRETIGMFAKSVRISYGQARLYFQSQIAVVQLLPYHSSKFSISNRYIKSLRSAQLAISFVHEELIPRAESNDCLVIATRALKHWSLAEQKNVVCYAGAEPRGAHLSPGSRGGKAMLEFLIRKYDVERAV